MSGKVMGWIWDSAIEDKTEKYVLLAYADHADHDGGGIFPSVALVAWKTGLTERYVRRVKAGLIKQGYMVETGISQHQTPIYKIIKDALPKREEWVRNKGGRPKNPPGPQNTPDYKTGVISEETPLTSTTNPPDPQDSQTVIEPSREPSTRAREKLNALADAIAQVCGTDIELASNSVKEKLKQITVKLHSDGITPADVAGFVEWWWGDTPSTINQFGDNWGRYHAGTVGEQSDPFDFLSPEELLAAQELENNGNN